MNIVTLSGGITQEPMAAELPSGKKVLELNICVNESYKDNNGEQQKKPNYFTIKYFKNFDRILEYLKVGTKLYVTGKLSYSDWTDKQTGKKRSKIDIIADQLEWSQPQGKAKSDIPF